MAIQLYRIHINSEGGGEPADLFSAVVFLYAVLNNLHLEVKDCLRTGRKQIEKSQAVRETF